MIQKVIPIITLSIFETDDIPKDLRRAFHDADRALPNNAQIAPLYELCNAYLSTEHFPASIFLLGIFLPRFLAIHERHTEAILELFARGLESGYPLKIPLCFAISQNADIFSNHKSLVRQHIFPPLMTCFPTASRNLVHWAFRAFWNLVIEGCHRIIPPLDTFFTLFPLLPNPSTRYLFSFLSDILTKDPKCAESVLQFSASVLDDAHHPLSVKADALSTLRIACKLLGFQSAPASAPGFARALLLSDCVSAYDTALSFLVSFARKCGSVDFGGIENRVLAIVTGELTCPAKVRLSTAYWLAKMPGFVYPPHAIHILLADESAPLQAFAVSFIREFWRTFARDHLLALFAMTAQLVRTSVSPDFVNQGFRLAADLLTLPGMPNGDALELLHAAMQGRLAMMKRSLPYNYNNPRFEFFLFLRMFIARFPSQSRWIVVAVLRWTGRVSAVMLPPVCGVLSAALDQKLVVQGEVMALFQNLAERLDEDDAVAVRAVVALLGKVRRILALDIGELLGLLERVWESRERDPGFVSWLAHEFLKVFAEKGFAIEGDFAVFRGITEAVVRGDVDDEPQIGQWLVTMIGNGVPFRNLDVGCALVFVRFLTRTRSMLLKDGFTLEGLVEMHRCLKLIARRNKSVIRKIEEANEGNSVIGYRVKQLLKANKLPEF